MKMNSTNSKYRAFAQGIIALICAFFIIAAGFPAITCAGSGTKTVRVGYYENEVFQEGAKQGAVKTGYAYEYYQKLSVYIPLQCLYQSSQFLSATDYCWMKQYT